MTSDENMPRQRLTISISTEVIKWIDKEIQEGTYYNRSHAIERCLLEKMKKGSE
jgi:Arc/MetJ-type ribon-helix-helix transcriptional regulator